MKPKNEKEIKEYLRKQQEKYPRDGIIKAVFISHINQKRYYIVDEGDDIVFPDINVNIIMYKNDHLRCTTVFPFNMIRNIVL